MQQKDENCPSTVPDKGDLSPVGPSTGWLSAKFTPALGPHNALLAETPATAAEMVCGRDERQRAMLVGDFDPELVFRSLHLGSFNGFEVKLTEHQRRLIDDLADIWRRHGVQGAAAHPDQMPPHMYEVLKQAGITVGIENMDRNKFVGRTVEQVDILIATHRTPAVLDLQHAFELSVDSGIPYDEVIQRLVKSMDSQGGITHLHVSGELTEGGEQILPHALLTMATNREAILNALNIVLTSREGPFPIILEGDPLPEFSFLSESQALRRKKALEIQAHATRNISQEIELLADAFPGKLQFRS